MISMRYGTIPIVTGVGGLRDTVTALGEGVKPNGLRVANPSTSALFDTVSQACRILAEDTGLLHAMIRNAMEKDVSWANPASQYSLIYHNLKHFKERSR